jgi:hypothetical protein
VSITKHVKRRSKIKAAAQAAAQAFFLALIALYRRRLSGFNKGFVFDIFSRLLYNFRT